jgi:hypothetical protein
MADAITLTIPHAPEFYGVVRLVVGGLAARLELPIEELDDAQTALEALLETEAYRTTDDVSVVVEVGGEMLAISVGPLAADALVRDLDAGRDGGLTLARMLAATTDRYELEQRDDGGWVRMERRIPERTGG